MEAGLILQKTLRENKYKRGTYAFMRNCKSRIFGQYLIRKRGRSLVTHPRSTILEDLSLRLDILRCGLGDGFLDSGGRHCGVNMGRECVEERLEIGRS